jgi:flagellar hook assembly protein FlgD
VRVVLEPNAPNPFNPATTIRFRLGEAGEARLTVFDPAGRLVAELFSGPASAGDHTTAWNGLDRSGREVGSGVYFYRLEAGRASWTRSMVLLR